MKGPYRSILIALCVLAKLDYLKGIFGKKLFMLSRITDGDCYDLSSPSECSSLPVLITDEISVLLNLILFYLAVLWSAYFKLPFVDRLLPKAFDLVLNFFLRPFLLPIPSLAPICCKFTLSC